MEQLAMVSNLSAEERRIAQIISKCRGRSQAISAKTLSYKVGIDERKVREIIKDLVERQYMPIGSSPASPAGYYIITDPQELRQVRHSLIGRAISILNRARVYDRAGWVKELIGQLSLRLETDRIEEQTTFFSGSEDHA